MTITGARLRILVSGIAVSCAIATLVLIPTGSLFAAHLEMAAEPSLQVRLKASRLARYIEAQDEPWRNQILRLAGVIEMLEANEDGNRQRIFDAAGEPLIETGAIPAPPVATQNTPIVVARSQVESTATFRSALISAGGLALGMLGSGIFFALRVLPLRVANRTVNAFRDQTVDFQSVLDNMSEGVCMFDAKKGLLVSNNRFFDLLGIPPEKVTVGMPKAELMALSEGTDSHERVSAAGIEKASILRRANGIIISVLRRQMPNGGEVITYEDITVRRWAEATIFHMVRHDALTNLPNTLLFHEALTHALSRARADENTAVLFLDIGNFKGAEGTLGYAVGDDLLKAVTLRLRNQVREADTVARLGDDEFAIVQTRVVQPFHATALAVRLIEALAAPFDIDGQSVVVGANIGIALAPGDGTESHQLLRHAGMALQRAKADGRGSHRYFEPEMDARMKVRRTLEVDLRKAAQGKQFELFYQPVVDIDTEEVAAFEALLRWNHPERGMVQPNDFIPLAEETGLIVPIGEWVISQACKEAAGWPSHLKVAVNLSPVQFTSRKLVPSVRAALDASGLAPDRLELEVTESVLLRDDAKTMEVLRRLHEIGVSISMDDFGTGYSSLGYLRKFPFDKIKIDRSFVIESSERGDSLAIIRAVAAIGVSLGMPTTAEGVETREQFELVKNEGCAQAQGYLFGAPQPATQIAKFLAAANRKARMAGLPSVMPTAVAAAG